MKDELKLCRCGQKHYWGIVGRSRDNVNLYGARPEGGCDNFREDTEESRALATMDPKEVGELWSRTAFLNPQVPVATRLMVARIMELGQDETGVAKMEKQWPEFIGLTISQLGDIRGAMVRDESKFAHLVAHTDEVVEAMRGIVGLKEQLMILNAKMDRIGMAAYPEARPWAIQRFFAYIGSKLRGEPIVTDAVNLSEDVE